MCQKTVGEVPYWCCTACDGEYNVSYGIFRYTNVDSATYVCISCNLGEEKEKSWLFQLKANSDKSHRIQHILVLVTDRSTLTEREPTTIEQLRQLQLQLERRLDDQATAIDGLRAQFADHEKVISGRFQTLEGLLERVLAMGGNGGS